MSLGLKVSQAVELLASLEISSDVGRPAGSTVLRRIVKVVYEHCESVRSPKFTEPRFVSASPNSKKAFKPSDASAIVQHVLDWFKLTATESELITQMRNIREGRVAG